MLLLVVLVELRLPLRLHQVQPVPQLLEVLVVPERLPMQVDWWHKITPQDLLAEQTLRCTQPVRLQRRDQRERTDNLVVPVVVLRSLLQEREVSEVRLVTVVREVQHLQEE
jgi:hypothetical protein